MKTKLGKYFKKCWMDRDNDLSKILDAGSEIRTNKKFQVFRDKFHVCGTNLVKSSERDNVFRRNRIKKAL